MFIMSNFHYLNIWIIARIQVIAIEPYLLQLRLCETRI